MGYHTLHFCDCFAIVFIFLHLSAHYNFATGFISFPLSAQKATTDQIWILQRFLFLSVFLRNLHLGNRRFAFAGEEDVDRTAER